MFNRDHLVSIVICILGDDRSLRPACFQRDPCSCLSLSDLEGCGRVRQVTWQRLSCAGFLKPSQQQQQPQQQSKHADLPLGSRLSSYTSAASRSATPKANAESSSWNGSLDSSASYAAVQVR